MHSVFQVYDKVIDPSRYEGGAAEVVLEQSLELKKEFDVTVITGNKAPAFDKVFDVGKTWFNGLRLLRLRGVIHKDSPPPFCRRVNIPSLADKLEDLIRNNGSAIIHTHFMVSNVALQALTIAKENRIPSIYQPHFHPAEIYPKEERMIRRRYMKTDFTRKLKTASVIIAVSSIEKRILTGYGVERSKICIIPNGVDIEKLQSTVKPSKIFDKYSISRDNQLILTVGRLSPRKNVYDVVRAFKMVHRAMPKTTLIICGRKGKQYAQIQTLIEENHLKKAVKHLGFVPNAVRNTLLKMADVFVTLSKWESFGIAAAQALASGTPVVATKVGGLPSFVKHNENGFLVPVGDINQAAESIKVLLKNEEKAISMGEKGRENIATHFTWDEVGEKLRRVYEELLNITKGGANRYPFMELEKNEDYD